MLLWFGIFGQQDTEAHRTTRWEEKGTSGVERSGGESERVLTASSFEAMIVAVSNLLYSSKRRWSDTRTCEAREGGGIEELATSLKKSCECLWVDRRNCLEGCRGSDSALDDESRDD